MMLEFSRFSGPSNAIRLDFVERVATPLPIMKMGIRLHLAGLSLAKTVSFLEKFDVSRSKSTVRNRVQKAQLEPLDGRVTDLIALDETIVKLDGERHWLYMAEEQAINYILHLRLFPSRTLVLAKLFLRELADKHDIADAEVLVDGAPWLQAGLFELSMHFRYETFGDRNPVERMYQEIKRQTNQVYNTFVRADPETAENWLQALAGMHNEPI